MNITSALGPRRTASVGVVADGAVSLGLPGPDLFAPFPVDTISVDPWPLASSDALALLGYLEGRYASRPLLAITDRLLTDAGGLPLRGLSRSGSGLAIASCHGLDLDGAAGVMRHELAHSFGMAHCERWACALSERPHPLGIEDRPAELCPSCQALWATGLETSP